MANTNTSHDDKHDAQEVVSSSVQADEQEKLEHAAESNDTDTPLINTEDIDPNPWGAVAITAILAVIILITWYSMFALNLARG